MKISEILWKAANKCLTDDPWVDESGKTTYTCDAVELAIFGRVRGYYRTPAHTFMRSLGCKCACMYQFDEFHQDNQQQARYAWLMFASMYAEEQGL